MTKIDCKKGTCKLVPSTRQVGRGLTSRPTFYLVPINKTIRKSPKKSLKGSGKVRSKTGATKKSASKKTAKSKSNKNGSCKGK